MRMLGELIPEAKPFADVQVSGLAMDSRQVSSGDLFLAFPGARHDGRDFIQEAIGRDAAAIVYELFSDGREIDVRVPCVGLEDVSAKVGEIASRYFGNPSDRLLVIAITGTNGKTSCSHFIAEALGVLGRKCGVIGTMGKGFPGSLTSGQLTTPDAISLQQALAEIADQDGEAVALEASSHGLTQGRLGGTSVDVAVFTNLTRDHLDYHRSIDEYRQAKRRLFEWPGLKSVVLNIDDEFGKELASSVGDDVRVLTYSRTNPGADLYCQDATYPADGLEAKLVSPWGEGRISAPLIGDFNLSNILAVAGVLGLLDYGIKEIETAIKHLQGVRGRMDVISRPGAPTVVIDYAHTPDALEKVIEAARRHCKASLWCVFGCGGDRDKGKRPLMGQVAEKLADYVVLTDDNPRSEASGAIVDEILEGISDQQRVWVETDRATAIADTLSRASSDDIVLIAGKGHEEYQEIDGNRVDYSDYVQVEKFLAGKH